MASRFGKYWIDYKVAVGGMAEIFRGHSTSGTQVAVKKIHPNYSSQPKFIQMFLDEARIVIGLRHPNIVQLLDFGKIDDTYFFSMDWIDGRSLSEVVNQQRQMGLTFPIDVALFLMIDAAEGLSYAHNKKDQYERPLNIVHRDVSPPNILVSRECVAKIADFGIADVRNKGSQTQPGVIRGKFSYMSPEQSRGDNLDRRSDIFSLGIVLYELLSGDRLFLKESEPDTIEAVRRCKVPRLRNRRTDISPQLENVILKTLAPSARRRFSDGRELADALAHVLNIEFPRSRRKDVGEFFNRLFGGEDFQGSESGMEVPSPREVTPVEVPAPGDPIAWFSRHPVLLSLALGLLCLLLAELLSR